MPLQRGAAAAAGLAAALLLASGAATLRAADLFDEIYLRGQERNGQLQTFTARFTETTESPLLTRPLTARGTVAVERPSRVALRYTEPDERVVIIDGARMTVAWPARGIRQSRDVGAAQGRIRRYFVEGSPTELRKHFDITATRDDRTGGYRVVMVPTRKQIREGLSRLELAIDPGSLLMTAMEMTFATGDRKGMTFTDVRPNAPIDRGLFQAPPARP
jgi:outer membrane lipoprotein-sorting protein